MIQSPAVLASRRTSCQARSGSSGDRAVEQVVRKPVQLERRLAQEVVRDVEERARPVAAGGGAEAAADGGQQRVAHAEHRTDARGDPTLALEVLRVRERWEPGPERRGHVGRIGGEVACLTAQRGGGVEVLGDERLRTQRGFARHGLRDGGRCHRLSTLPGVTAVVPPAAASGSRMNP